MQTWLPLSKARDLFAALQSYWDWNARYWEQRALLEAADGEFGRAQGYANRSISIEDHAFAHNTLGKIYLQLAESQSGGTRFDAPNYWRGVGELRLARDARTRERFEPTEHPYITFFHYTLELLHLVPRETVPEAHALEREWNDWLLRARGDIAFAETEDGLQIDQFQARWFRYWAEQR